ncbi:hypothetical protein NE237_000295 [Protea cynaroides]|uniref:Pentatricopeptide repeat-containing protein n=1 Tax=Protea cynaroides TaxID=273540 RepID=A0A9Q0KRX3_9MAGN|nr:hypothetical protein NE237_000295 [Protea cynaroides]
MKHLNGLRRNKIHSPVIKKNFEPHIFVGCSLLDMYAKAGRIHAVRGVFDGLPERDVVSCTAIIAGYAQLNLDEEALELFSQLQKEGMESNCWRKMLLWRLLVKILQKVYLPTITTNGPNLKLKCYKRRVMELRITVLQFYHHDLCWLICVLFGRAILGCLKHILPYYPQNTAKDAKREARCFKRFLNAYP